MSNLRTELAVDDPVDLTAGYKIGSVADRRKIDDQIIDLQQVIVDALISGHTDSFFSLSTQSPKLTVGDAFCLSQTEPNGSCVTKALSATIGVAGSVLGIAATVVAPGTSFRGITRGVVPTTIASVGPGISCDVGLNATTGRLVRVPSPTVGVFLVGTCDTNGVITLSDSGAFAGGGGGGGGIEPVGEPDNGDIIAWDATTGQWVTTSRTPFSLTSFAAVIPLIEVGASAVNPAFIASMSAALVTGDTAVLTNNSDSESKDVHATPTSFASSHTFAFTAVGQTKTFTYTVMKAGNPTAIANASLFASQRNYVGSVPAGASLATLVAAASYNQLDTDGLFSFTVTDDGTHQIQLSRPTRFGTPTVKDVNTGIGVGITFLRTTSWTNASGFTENYNQYTFDAPVNGTASFSAIG